MVVLESRFGILKGELDIYVYDRDGKVKDYQHVSNLVVNVGKGQIISLVGGASQDYFKYIAFGTGTTAENVNDVGLENEVYRKNALISYESHNFANDTVVFDATFTALDILGQYSVTEAGIFNDSGVMLSRRVFPVVNVDFSSGDVLRIVWRIQIR